MMTYISRQKQIQPGYLSPPLIGIPTWTDRSTAYAGVTLYALNQSYANAIVEAGGLPVLIPLNLDRQRLCSLFEQLDGLFLAGGTDIAPQRYGDELTGTEGDIDCNRDRVELTLACWAMDYGLPLFGVCRGMQIINVAAGGTVYHDLASDLPHVSKHDFFAQGEERQTIRHNIFVESDSFLGERLGEIIGVNSMHHQAIKTVGEGLRVTAISEDGLIEGIEGRGAHFIVGCQWHPEELTADSRQASLLSAFINAATWCHQPHPF